MPRNTSWSLLISIIALLSPCTSAAQEPLDSFRVRLADFARGLQARDVPIEFIKIEVAEAIKISEPEKQALEILKSARLLVMRDGGFEAWTLAQLGASGRDLKWMADTLVEYDVVRRGDYLAQVDWSLPEQRFHTLAAVRSKNQATTRCWLRLRQLARSLFRLRPIVEPPPPDFEPLLYFTPVRIEENLNDNEMSLAAPKMPLHLPDTSGPFVPILAAIPAAAPQSNGSWQLSGARKLAIWNGYEVCATVIWEVMFQTDGCRILDKGNHVYPSVEISPSLSCLFWDIEHKAVEVRSWTHRAQCYPRPGADESVEECLKSTLEYTPGLRLLSRFIPLRNSSSTKPQYICCSNPPQPSLNLATSHLLSPASLTDCSQRAMK